MLKFREIRKKRKKLIKTRFATFVIEKTGFFVKKLISNKKLTKSKKHMFS